MLLPAPGGVNGAGLLGYMTKAVSKDKLLFLEVPFSHRLMGPEDLR